jgi:hypothetical protein
MLVEKGAIFKILEVFCIPKSQAHKRRAQGVEAGRALDWNKNIRSQKHVHIKGPEYSESRINVVIYCHFDAEHT